MRWHWPACCPGPAVSYMHRPMEPCILHPPTGDTGIAQAGPPERVRGGTQQTRKCVCARVTLAVCPRGCVTAPGREQRHA